MAKAAFNKKNLFASKLGLNLKRDLAFYGTETWALWKADQNNIERFEMWCWRRTKISWTNHVKKMKTCYKESRKEYLIYNKNES
jgi:hypothetical protein